MLGRNLTSNPFGSPRAHIQTKFAPETCAIYPLVVYGGVLRGRRTHLTSKQISPAQISWLRSCYLLYVIYLLYSISAGRNCCGFSTHECSQRLTDLLFQVTSRRWDFSVMPIRLKNICQIQKLQFFLF